MFIITPDQLDREVARLTDHFTDELFDFPFARIIRFPVSRLVVDPERFDSDVHEPMSAKGMGVLYTHGVEGTRIRRDASVDERKLLLDRFYRPHHEALFEAVADAIGRLGGALIMDAHSFPDIPLCCDLDQRQPRPDICIGTDAFHTPDEMVEVANKWWLSRGFTVGIDWPYRGTLVPAGFLKSDRRVRSIMVEINRRLYMRLNDGVAWRSADFQRTQSLVRDFAKFLIANDLANLPSRS